MTPDLYASLARIVFAGQSQNEILQQIARLARDALPETPEVSVTMLRRPHRATTVASSGGLAKHLDELQYEHGRGPCLDAAASGACIALAMDDPSTPYPEFAAAALGQGVSHTVSVGLQSSAGAFGSLNVYHQQGRPFGDESQDVVCRVAAAVAVFLTNLSLYHDARALAAHLQTAMQSRAVIEQAKGVIMSQESCSAETAFRVLARQSQNQNLKLREVAELLVRRATGYGSQP